MSQRSDQTLDAARDAAPTPQPSRTAAWLIAALAALGLTAWALWS